MTIPPPSVGDPNRVPAAPLPYAAASPPEVVAPWAGSPAGQQGVPPQVAPWAGSPGTLGTPTPAPASARPSWVAWTALGLSALAFLLATAIGILYAADRFGGSLNETFYDAGTPTWGAVDLTETGAVTDRALTDSVTEAVIDVLGDGVPIENVLCEALPAPRTNSVATCSALIDKLDSTVVLFFTDDSGSYLATIY